MYNIFAQGVGFLAMLFCIGSYQLKSGKMLIMCKALGDSIYVLHYLLLGAYSGCATVAVCALNGLVCSGRGSRWADWKGWKWFFSALLLLASLIAWHKSFTLIPDVCSFISIMAVIWTTWSGDARIIRVSKLAVAGPTFLIYGLYAHSYAGVLCEVIGMTSAAISIFRYGLKRTEDDL